MPKKQLYSDSKMREMRQRLYQRGAMSEEVVRHGLSDEKVDVTRNWQQPAVQPTSASNGVPVGGVEALRQPVPSVAAKPPAVNSQEQQSQPPTTTPNDFTNPPKPRRRYRVVILAISFLIFVAIAALSSTYLFYGGNQVSSGNIQITLQAPPLVGGGEEVSLEAIVTNKNSVAIEAATLILRYPAGTRSVGDSPRNLFEERIQLNDIASGEVQNIPVRVAIFGEESEEKEIKATVEYRIGGANGTFYKDAAPLTVQISSSPLVLRIDNIEKVSSGQQVEFTIVADSNSSQPLSNILISASYPNGFSFESSDPQPVYGRNVWKIDEISSGNSKEIKVRGNVTGLSDETFRINFEAGSSDTDNQYIVSSTLAEAYADFSIEKPFIDVKVSIDGKTTAPVVIKQGDISQVKIDITNTIDETIYDMKVEVAPTGSAISPSSIVSNNGFYDSNDGTVSWEVSNQKSFDKVLSGDSRSIGFSVKPNDNYSSASYGMKVNVYARRIGETSAQETLLGSVDLSAKYESEVLLGAQASRNNAGFSDIGPIPPQVGETTSYTLTLIAEAGANSLDDAVVKTSLPIHVKWLDKYDVDGTLEYNAVSKEITWQAGSIPAGVRKQLEMQLSITPSVSQLKSAPVLLKEQYITATDKFTDTEISDSANFITTELSTEMGYQQRNGSVVD